jgi:hypothetical protein
MTRSQANRIEEILRTQDMRSPRVTLDAVAAILDETPSIKPEPESSDFQKMLAAMLASAEESDDEIPHLVPGDVQNEFGNPVATIRIYNTKPRPGKLNVCVAIDCCDEHIEPRHFVMAKQAFNNFALAKIERNKQEAGQ